MSVIWIVTLGLILVSVLKVIVSVVAYFMDMPESISLAIIVSFLILATILVDNKLMGIIKTIVFIMVIIVCLTMIGLVFTGWMRGRYLTITGDQGLQGEPAFI